MAQVVAQAELLRWLTVLPCRVEKMCSHLAVRAQWKKNLALTARISFIDLLMVTRISAGHAVLRIVFAIPCNARHVVSSASNFKITQES